LNNDFPLTNSILKVNIIIVWLETPIIYHQSLYIMISSDYNRLPNQISNDTEAIKSMS